MTNIDPEHRYNSLPAALRFAFEQWTKGLYTAAPGIVHAYDAATRRATVQPALDILTTDGRSLPAPLIPNVPTIWPSAGGFSLHAPLAEGDPVLIVWSRRGLTGFKRSHGRAMPDADRLLDVSDAIVVPGFGPTSITPASTTGIVLQNDDASAYVALEPDGIRIVTTGTVTINGADVQTV